MAYYADGPVAADVLTVQAVQYAGLAAELPAVASGLQRVDVTTIAASHQNGPNALVGRQVDISDPNAPPLVTPTDAEALAARRPAWLARLGTVYLRGRDDVRLWWPDDEPNAGPRRRARDVIQFEIPNWWLVTTQAAAQAVTGRAWPTMTAAQIEAAVAHLEGLLVTDFPASGGHPAAYGIMRRWYDVGAAMQDLQDGIGIGWANMATNGRVMTNWADLDTALNGYTDCYSIEAGVLTPRTPDYAWLQLTGYNRGAVPAGYNPERPS